MNDSYVKYLKPLHGGKIKHLIVDVDPAGDTYMGFVVEKDGETFEVLAMADPEGNGPGFMRVENVSTFYKKKVDKSATV